jgi:hypothetical protein
MRKKLPAQKVVVVTGALLGAQKLLWGQTLPGDPGAAPLLRPGENGAPPGCPVAC